MKKKETINLSNNKKALKHMQFLYAGLLILLIINLVYFVFFTSANVVINAYNPRLSELEDNIIRGKILDREGEVLADTLVEDGIGDRVYPYENAFSHVLGYVHQGKTGIEALANISLLKSNMTLPDQVYSELTNQKKIGDNVVTTLDTALQLEAYELLGKKRGAIIAMEPSTGKILCMVSKPDFDPNLVDLNWEKLIADDKNSPLLNRGTQGLYPPGSTFKILTAMEYLNEHHFDDSEFTVDCQGKAEFDEKVIHCFNNKAHGVETLQQAFAYSCNVAFAQIGDEVDIDGLGDLAETLLFNQELPYSLPYSQSSFTLTEDDSSAKRAETVIGQGDLMITPLHNLLITATIANGGTLMKPYLIDRIENYEGKIVEKNMPQKVDSLLDVELTRMITEYMVEVVETGTAKKISNEEYTIAGKTGSAENPFGDSHAWFVAFAPAEQPTIAIVILLENGGNSTESAVPMAKKLFDLYLNEESE